MPTVKSLLFYICRLPVPHRIDFKLLVFTYKAVHGDAPKYLSDLVCPYKPVRALRSANNNLLTVVRTHVKAGDNSFVVAAATLRNVLPRTYIHWTAVFCRSRRFATGGVSCKGHELRRGSPDFRSASHCVELPNIERILAVNKTV